MPQSRKWTHRGPEARQLAARGLSPTMIAAQLGIDRSTVYRWIRAGHLPETAETQALAPTAPPIVLPAPADVPARGWAASIRAVYTLDATDEQLVDLADFALSVIENPKELPSVRLAAAGRFQSLVKQLASRIRPVAAAPAPAPTPAPSARVDPRALLNSTIQ